MNYGEILIENWGISILIILGAIIIVKLLSLLGKKVIKPFVTGTDNHLDDVIFTLWKRLLSLL